MPKPPQLPRLHWPTSFTQTRVALALKAATLLAAIVIVFYQDLVLIYSDALLNETTNYILAVPFILILLVYRKRRMLRAVLPLKGEQPRNTRHLASLSGLLLTVTAIILYWHGSSTSTALEYHMFALPLFTSGLILVLFNPQTLRNLAFPVAFLFFLLPLPSEILYVAGSTLQVLSAETSNAIVTAFNIPSTLTTDNGNPLITLTRPDGSTPSYLIDITRSGLYSLIGFAVFAVTIAYMIRDKPWKKAALIMIGIPLIYFLNIVRITTMLFLGYNLGMDLALQSLNLLGGFVVILIGTLVLLVISEKALKTQIFPKTPVKCAQCDPEPHPSRDYCRGCGRIFHPAITKLNKTDLAKAVAIILVAGLLVTIFAIKQAAPTITLGASSEQQYSTSIFPQNNQYILTFHHRDLRIENWSKQDLTLIYLYTPINESYESVDLTLEIASDPYSLPPLEKSSSAAALHKINSTDVQLPQHLIGHYFVYSLITSEIKVMLYWYTSAVFTMDQTTQQKQVEISLVASSLGMDEVPAVEQQLMALAIAIVNYWQPTQIWSEGALIVSQNGITLSTITSAALAATLIYYAAETRKRRRANLKATSKLTSLGIEIVRAIQKTRRPATLENLASTLQKNTGQTMVSDQLEQRLMELENAGIIRSQIYNQNDTPVQTWKT